MAKPEYNDLPAIRDGIWQMLAHGAASGRSAFHLPALTTVATDGVPEVRTVVLRDADANRRRLICHTDVRSAKVTAIQAQPRVAWLFYDQAARVQVRATGIASIHQTDELADERWAASNNFSRRCYLAPLAPGTPTEMPDPNLPDDVRDLEPSTKRTEDGRPQFAVISCVIDTFDWLDLAHDGHRRARFKWDSAAGSWDATWVAV